MRPVERVKLKQPFLSCNMFNLKLTYWFCTETSWGSCVPRGDGGGVLKGQWKQGTMKYFKPPHAHCRTPDLCHLPPSLQWLQDPSIVNFVAYFLCRFLNEALINNFFFSHTTSQHNIHLKTNKTKQQTHTPYFKGPIKGEREREGKSNDKTGPSFI